jgi:hypothetical protein
MVRQLQSVGVRASREGGCSLQLFLMMHVVLIPKLALSKNELWPRNIRGCCFVTS